MNKINLLGGILVGVSVTGSALAADLPIAAKAPPMAAAPAYNWTGFYAGATVSYGWGSDPTTVSTVRAKTLRTVSQS